MATSGCALPYAIAAAIAEPGRMAVAVGGGRGDEHEPRRTGDLRTAPAKSPEFLVLRNNTLGWVRWDKMVFAGNPEYGCDLEPVDFAAVAREFGLPGLRFSPDPRNAARRWPAPCRPRVRC